MTEKLLTETLNYKSNQTKLFQGLRALNEEEEVRLHEILATISDNVRRRRLMMYPYFKDYDRVRDVKFNTSCDAGKLVFWGFGPGPEVIKLFSCSAQLRLKFILLINVKMPTIVGILTFISRINY